MASTALGSERSHFLDINGRTDNFDIVQGELRSLGNDPSVDGNECTSVIVKSISVTTLLIGVEVDPSKLAGRSNTIALLKAMACLESCLLNEFNTGVKLSKLVVTATRIGEDLHSIQPHQNVGAIDAERLWIKIGSSNLAGVKSSSHSSTPMQVSAVLITASPKGTLVCDQGRQLRRREQVLPNLFRHSNDDSRKVVIFPFPVLRPWGEVSKLSIVAIVR